MEKTRLPIPLTDFNRRVETSGDLNNYVSIDGWDDKGNSVIGVKIYAGSGPGYDDPDLGWHECPTAVLVLKSVNLVHSNFKCLGWINYHKLVNFALRKIFTS
jgi:hypothetical protein